MSAIRLSAFVCRLCLSLESSPRQSFNQPCHVVARIKNILFTSTWTLTRDDEIGYMTTHAIRKTAVDRPWLYQSHIAKLLDDGYDELLLAGMRHMGYVQ